MRIATLAFIGLMSLLAHGSCASTQAGGADGNTNWLESCSDDSDCRGGLVCECGRCTRNCGSESDCFGLSGARCAAATAVHPGCAAAGTNRICVASCETSEDCSGELDTCRDAICGALSSKDAGAPASHGASGSASTGGSQGFGGASPSAGGLTGTNSTGGSEEPPPFPPETRCYELRNHGEPTVDDATPYDVGTGERVVSFYFDPPYDEPSVLVGWRSLLDKADVVHRWQLYAGGDHPAGGIERTIGSYIGENVELIAASGINGNDVRLPPGVGIALPPPSGKLFVEWHFYNETGTELPDRSAVEICIVPASSIDSSKIAGLTLLGAEDFRIPPSAGAEVQSSCTPSFADVETPIRIVGWNPHMHQQGLRMRTWIQRREGRTEKVFDEPYQFSRQLYYAQPVVELHPGDRIISECFFLNPWSGPLGHGPSSESEECYQLVVAYPKNALNNGAFSITGAVNTCWDRTTSPCPECD